MTSARPCPPLAALTEAGAAAQESQPRGPGCDVPDGRTHAAVTQHACVPCCSSPSDFFRDLAPVTRLLLVTYLITGLGAALKVVPLTHMYHMWGLEFTLKTFPQVRR